MKWPTPSCGLLRGIAAGILLLLVGAISSAPAQADEARQLTFNRTAKTLGDLPCIDFAIEGVGSLRDGKISGTVTVSSTLTHSATTEEVAEQQFAFEGTYGPAKDDPEALEVHFRVSGKLTYLCTKAPPKCEPGGFCVGQLWEYDWSGADAIFAFDVALVGGKFAERKQVQEGNSTLDIATTMELSGGESKGEILVVAEDDRIPSGPIPDISGTRHTVGTRITVTLPADEALEAAYQSGKRIVVRATPKSYGGRLYETKDAAESAKGGALWLELTGLAPGRPRDFYYAWPREQSPVLEHESVTVELIEPEGFTFTGEASFDVGFEPAVWNVRFVNEDKKRRILVSDPLRIQVVDALTDGPVSAMLDKFHLAPVLRLEQTDFEAPPLIGYVVDWFGFDLLAWGEYLQSVVTPGEIGDPEKGPVRITGSDRAWRVAAEDGSLVGNDRLPRPTLFFRNVGTYGFEASIAGLVFDGGSAPFDASAIMGKLSTGLAEPYAFKVEVTELPEVGGLLGVLFNCVGIAGDALELKGLPPEKITAFKRLKFIWKVLGCLKGAGVYTAGILPKRGVELQMAGRAARQIAEAPLSGLSEEETLAIGRSPAKEEERRVQEAQAVVRGLDDLRLVMIRQSGLTGLAVESRQDGPLAIGPDDIDPAALVGLDEGDGAHDTEAASHRIQVGDRFVIVPVRLDEALHVHSAHADREGALFIVTSETITRADIPAATWQAGIDIDKDGAIQPLRGAEAQTTSVAPLDLGEAIELPDAVEGQSSTPRK